jgi:hypothetical protein
MQEDLIKSYGDYFNCSHRQATGVSLPCSTEQAPSSEPNSCSPSQEIPRILRKPKVHYPAPCSANTMASLHLQKDIDFISTCYLIPRNVDHARAVDKVSSPRLAHRESETTEEKELQVSLYMRKP